MCQKPEGRQVFNIKSFPIKLIGILNKIKKLNFYDENKHSIRLNPLN